MFKGKDDTTLVQFQRDRFLYNWRKLDSKKPYPRYEKVIGAFLKNYAAFESCLAEMKLPNATIEMLELSYINLIPISSFGGLKNLGDIFEDISWKKRAANTPQPTKFSLLWQFNVPQNKSLMNVHTVMVQSPETGEDMLRVELSVKGQAPDVEISQCKNWFDNSREAIVNTFTDLTTVKAHKLWGRYE